jgi:type III restriction enzyme
MLTEGWDANTVTHVLGVRAFGTQLLCEQVIGRALRRQSYDLNEEGLFNVEYADVLGIPFDFTAKPVVAPPQPPRETIHVRASAPSATPARSASPASQGYRVELPEERLRRVRRRLHARADPGLVGPSITRNEGIIGEGVDLTSSTSGDVRQSTLIFHLTKHLSHQVARPGRGAEAHLFGQLKRITRSGSTTTSCARAAPTPAQLLYQELADMACERITAGITPPHRRAAGQGGARPLQPGRLHRPRQLHHLEGATAGRPTTTAATSTG